MPPPHTRYHVPTRGLRGTTPSWVVCGGASPVPYHGWNACRMGRKWDEIGPDMV
jgi:hypothetical protein